MMTSVFSRLLTISTFCKGDWSMKVYSLIAPTNSEIREVLLSIWLSRSAISTEAEILTNAARAVPASSVVKSCSNAAGFTFFRARSAASCHRSF